MGIACAPQIWMTYITLILNNLDQKSKFIAIMDHLLIHSTKQKQGIGRILDESHDQKRPQAKPKKVPIL